MLGLKLNYVSKMGPYWHLYVWPCLPTINLGDISWICDGLYVHTGGHVPAMNNMYA